MIGAGQQIGGYTVLHLLGKGGMGEVYLAQHRRVARRAAIKVLVPELSQNEVVLQRFFNEALATSRIRHPGIVEILDCDLHLGQAYIVMEFLEGESFGGYLYRTGPLDSDPAFFYGVATAVAAGVGAAHATGIVHRDLKPDNIFLHLPGPAGDATVTVKILDFGIAKLAQQDGTPNQTGTGVLLGTPAYMSPEQCRGAGRVDSRSDIYSLGCILYEALTGGPPFIREGFGDLIVAHVSEAPVPLTQRVPGVAADLDALVLRMLAKAPDDRPQSMNDVVTALRACALAANVSPDGPLRGRIPVERPPERLEGAMTQPAAAAPGPSGVETAPLGPTPRPRGGAVEERSGGGPSDRSGGAPSGRPSSDRSGGLSAERSGAVPSLGADAGAGSTRILTATADQRYEAPRTTTTFGSTAAEVVRKPAPRVGRWAAVAGGAVVIVGGIALFGSRSTTPPTSTSASLPSSPSAATPPTTPPASGVPAPARPVETAPPVAPPADDTVRVDLQGAPASTTAEVDGHPAPLPIKLPRGPELHHIVLQVPGESPRTIEVDGTRDRIVDMVVTAAAAAAKKPSTELSDGRGGRERSTAEPRRTGPGTRERARAQDRERGPADKKSPAAPSDREAITDI